MALGSVFSLFSSDLAIDLGTANTCVYARGKGIVVNEPSIVAINKVNGRVEAVGKDAKDMLGRTPGNIVAIKPMKDGVIADFEVTEKMLTYFIKKAHNRNVWVRPRIVIGVPSEITQVEKRAVKDSAYRAKASEVHLARLRPHGAVAHRAALDLRDLGRHADHDPRAQESAALVGLLDEVREHLLGGLEVGDDAVLHRLDGGDVSRRAAEHLLGFDADRLDAAVDFVQGDDGWLADDDAASSCEDAGVGRAEIDRKVVGETGEK